jgi:hypothetical protein
MGGDVTPRPMTPAANAYATRDRAIQWMNRGHALSVRGALREALVGYAQAITLLRTLPVTEVPAWANSLGAALMNYGQLLHRAHGLVRADDALNAFADAIVLLGDLSLEQSPWPRRNLAGTRVNRANLLLDLARFADAAVEARSARDLVAPRERDDIIDADLALKARRALCDALGQEIGRANAGRQDALAVEAADAVDDALALVRFWSARGETGFGLLAVRFFRFGAELYRRHQPHFLVEFIEENLAAGVASDDELRVIAHLALEAALADGNRPALLQLDDAASERALRTRRELAIARSRLATSPVST